MVTARITNEPQNQNRRADDKTGWRFQRTLSLDSLLAVGAAAVAIIFFGTTLDKRLSVMETRYETDIRNIKMTMDQNETAQKERAQRIENTVNNQAQTIQNLMLGINSKQPLRAP